jgi:hypothetical protein
LNDQKFLILKKRRKKKQLNELKKRNGRFFSSRSEGQHAQDTLANKPKHLEEKLALRRINHVGTNH